MHLGENFLPLSGFEPRKSRSTLFSIPIKLYRVPNDDDDDDYDNSTNKSILLIINPRHETANEKRKFYSN